MATESHDYLSTSVIDHATSLLNQGDVSGAWQVLADNGDTYADNAAVVTGNADNPTDKFYQYMVKNNWSNATGGSEAYNTYFNDVAQQHLQNYLNMLRN
jgi:hypothetical protein